MRCLKTVSTPFIKLDLKKCRTIFSDTPEDLNTIMKYQKEVLSETNDNSISIIVPRLLYEALDILASCLRTRDNKEISKLICKLNGTEELYIEMEHQILETKLSINKGDWSVLHGIEDLQILSELMFDWIDDCVVCLLSSNKIIYLGKSMANYACEDGIDLITTNPKVKEQIITRLVQECKTHLSKVEFEVILEISYFLCLIKTSIIEVLGSHSEDDNLSSFESEINDYSIFIERLCVSCLGLQSFTEIKVNDKLRLTNFFMSPFTKSRLKDICSTVFCHNTEETKDKNPQYALDFLQLMFNIMSSDLMTKRNEAEMMKRNNLCLSTLYSRSQGFINEVHADIKISDEQLHLNLLEMHKDLDQFLAFGVYDQGFYEFFIQKYRDLFEERAEKKTDENSVMFCNGNSYFKTSRQMSPKFKINPSKRPSSISCTNKNEFTYLTKSPSMQLNLVSQEEQPEKTKKVLFSVTPSNKHFEEGLRSKSQYYSELKVIPFEEIKLDRSLGNKHVFIKQRSHRPSSKLEHIPEECSLNNKNVHFHKKDSSSSQLKNDNCPSFLKNQVLARKFNSSQSQINLEHRIKKNHKFVSLKNVLNLNVKV